jgi:hypothetical protein
MIRLLEHRWRHDGSWHYPLDSPQVYKRNLLTQTRDWVWRDYPLRYRTNSQGYRTEEFDSIDWSQSVVFFGCSNVYGEGIGLEHTAAGLTPGGVNLGMGGAGPDFILANSIRLANSGVSPRACVYVWPNWSRCLEYITEDRVELWGPWNVTSSQAWAWPFMQDDLKAQQQALDCYNQINRLWSCPIVHVSYRWELCQLLGSACEYVAIVDRARDLIHPGIESNKNLARLVEERLAF